MGKNARNASYRCVVLLLYGAPTRTSHQRQRRRRSATRLRVTFWISISLFWRHHFLCGPKYPRFLFPFQFVNFDWVPECDDFIFDYDTAQNRNGAKIFISLLHDNIRQIISLKHSTILINRKHNMSSRSLQNLASELHPNLVISASRKAHKLLFTKMVSCNN